jgi:hypothetical protein
MHSGFLLREPQTVTLDMKQWVGHYGTLTPFARACERLGPVPQPQRRPAAVTMPPRFTDPGEVSLAALDLARMPVRQGLTLVHFLSST